MTITPIGLLLLPCIALALIVRRNWLFPLLIVSATLHAPAVAIVHGTDSTVFGLTPWLLTATACLLHLAGILLRQPQALHDWRRAPQGLFLPWLGFFVVAIVSAFTLPFLFRGMEVFPLYSAAGFDAPPAPLQWSSSNLVQSINCAIVLTLAPYAANCATRPGFRRRVALALSTALLIGVCASLYQRAEYLQWLPPPTWWNESLNPGYVHQMGWGIHLRGIGVPRMAWPFSEPSYASVWFAATFCGALLLLLFSRRHVLGAAGTLLSVLALLNTLGMSGVGAAVLVSLVAGTVFCWHLWRDRHGPDPRRGQRVLALLLMGAALASAWQARGNIEYLRGLTLTRVYDLMVAPRLTATDTSGQTRSHSNRHAAQLVLRTAGLGVGLGSNRASSYLTSAASNLGLVGLALLLLGIGRMLHALLARAAHDDSLAWFVLGGTSGAFVGVALGIPDLNWPAWWIWPLLGYALLTSPVAAQAASDSGR